MSEIGSHSLLVDLQIFFGLLGFSLSLVATLMAVSRLRSGAVGKERNLWLAISIATVLLVAINLWIALAASRYPASPVALFASGAMGIIILTLLVGIRLAVLIIDEALRREADLSEARQALSDHESGLQKLVAQRTQSLRKEISERREIQKKLHDWNRQRERELAMAGRVQQALLPDIQSPDFCSTQLVYQPYAEVSGDTYMFACDDNQLSLVLADAMGHGVPAALVTQVIQTQFLRMGVETPGDAMFSQLNDSLVRGAQVTYATASHLRVCRDGQAFFTSAGAPSLFIWRAATQAVEVVDGSGFPLGMFDDASSEYRVHALQLAPGDKLLLYTDGLSELKTSAGAHIGEEGLLAWFRQTAHASAAEIQQQVRNVLIGRDSIYQRNDDATLAVLEYAGKRP